MKPIHEYIQSKIARKIILFSSVAIIVLVVFELGMLAGYRKGTFSCRMSDNYIHIFGGEQRERMPDPNGHIPMGEMPGGHGAMGKIVYIDLPTVIVASPNNTEKSIYITDDTLIKNMNRTISASDLKIDDSIVVMGADNPTGQIEAKLIRLFPVPPGQPTSSTSENINKN